MVAVGIRVLGSTARPLLPSTSGTLGEALGVKSVSTCVCLETLFTATEGMKSEMQRGEGFSQCLLGRIRSAYPCLATVLKPISHTPHGEVRECQKISEELE